MQHGGRDATLRLGSGDAAMSIRARGRHRFGADAKPNDITLTRKGGGWFVSVTLRVPESACARQRADDQRRGVDFGVTHWATFDDGRTIDNPRWVREELPRLAALQRQRARKKKGSLRFKRLGRRIAQLTTARPDFQSAPGLRAQGNNQAGAAMRRPGDRAACSEDHEPQREGHGGGTGPSRTAKGRTQPGDPLGRVRHGASDARVQSGRRWYADAPEQYAPAQTVATLRGVLGDCAQDACRAHACVPALRACHATRPKQRVGGSHRRAQHAGHAWDGRGGETQTSAPATGQVQVCDPRNPRYNAMRFAAGEFIFAPA